MTCTPSRRDPDEPAGLSRRAVLRSTVVLTGTGVLGGLAACGSGPGRRAVSAGSAAPAPGASESATATIPPQPAAASSTTAPGQAALIAASEVPQDGGVVLADQKVVVTQPTAGHFKAFSAICTHQGCVVAEVSSAEIVCYCHGSRFSIDDGSVTNPPAQKALPPVPVTVRDGNVVRG